MKIENQAAAPVIPARASTVGGKQAGTFQAILSAQAQARSVGDSFSPAKTAATPSTTILRQGENGEVKGNRRIL